jgi:hypothetical protein
MTTQNVILHPASVVAELKKNNSATLSGFQIAKPTSCTNF